MFTPIQSRIQTIEYLDPRSNFLSLKAQMLLAEKYPQTFEHAVWASQVALSVFGVNKIPLFSDMCSSTNAQGNLKKMYCCTSSCPYIHHYPLHVAIQKLIEQVFAKSHLEKGRESPTFTESASSTRSSSPLPEEMKD